MLQVLLESSSYVPVGQVERHSKWYLNVPLKQRQTVESLLFSYPLLQVSQRLFEVHILQLLMQLRHLFSDR